MSSETHFDAGKVIPSHGVTPHKAVPKPTKGGLSGRKVETIRLGDAKTGMLVSAEKASDAAANSVIYQNKAGERYSVDINQLANELKISPDRIRKKAEEGTESLSKFLDQQANVTATFQRTKHFQNIIASPLEEHFEEGQPLEAFESDSEMLKSHATIMSNVSDEELRKTIEVSHKTLAVGQARKLRGKGGQPLPFVAKRLDKDNISILHLNKLLGKGSFGTVFRFRDITTGETDAIKFAKLSEEGALEDVQYENQVFRDVNIDGPHYGLPKASTHTVVDLSKKGPQEIGFMSPVYKGNYSKRVHKRKPKEVDRKMLMESDQLIQGLKTLHQKGYTHLDIKPENIFTDKNEDKENILYYGDFGGMQSRNRVAIPATTPNYIPLEESERLHGLEMEIRRGKTELTQEYIQCGQAIDVFALGTVLYQRASGGKFPYKHDEKDYPKVHKDMRELKNIDEDYKDYASLIEEMLDPDPTKRPTMDEVLARFNDLDIVEDNREYLDTVKANALASR